MRFASFALIAALLLPAALADASPPTRQEALAIAASFAEYKWLPTARNVLNGSDPAGISVRTPDRSIGNPELWTPGEESVGLPYK